MSTNLMCASGSLASPLSATLPGSFGRFGLPHPGEVKIPAAAHDRLLVVDVFVSRTGAAATIPVGAWLGPRGSTADPSLPTVGLSSIASPNQAHIRWTVTLGPKTAYVFVESWINNVGSGNGSSEIAFDPGVDNYLVIGTSSLKAPDTLTLISINVDLDGAAVPDGGINVLTDPLVVASDFFGLNTQDWPSRAGTSGGAAPTFPAGRVSTYDNSQTHWRTLQTEIDAINWANLDTFVAGARARGIARGVYVLYGCPTFLASTGAGVQGPYSGLGEGAFPNDLSQLAQFCSKFAARNRALWFGFFDFVQLFNEPDTLQAPSKTSFWWGSAPQLVDSMWTAYAAFKAADPALVIGSPGTFAITTDKVGGVDQRNGMDQWLDAAGSRYPTVRGRDCFDCVSAHPYKARPIGRAYPGQGDAYGHQRGGMRDFATALAKSGKVAGYAVTEYGVSSAAGDAELNSFVAATPEYRNLFMQRLYIDMLLGGARFVCVFSLGNVANLVHNIDAVPLAGLAPDDAGSKKALGDLYRAIVGKTVIAGGRDGDSRFLTFSDGSRYSI